MRMHRFRFRVPGDDGRPMEWPDGGPEGPFWVTGHGGDDDDAFVTVVAYSPDLETLTSAGRWPDAFEVDDLGEQEITFSGRFPKPEWWND